MKSLMFGMTAGNLPAATKWGPPWAFSQLSSGSSTNNEYLISIPCTISNFYVKTFGYPGTGAGWTFTFLKNNSASGLACSIIGADVDSDLDDVNSITFTQADIDAGNNRLSLQCNVTGTPTLTNACWGFQIEGTNAKESLLGGRLPWSLSTTDQQFLPTDGSAIFTASQESQSVFVAPCAGKIKNLCAKLSAAPGAGATRTLTVRKNTEDTAVVVAFGAADTYQTSGAASVAVEAGDLICISSTMSASPAPAAASVKTGLAFEATIDGQFIIPLANRAQGMGRSGTSYIMTRGSNLAYNATIALRQQLVPVAFVAKSIYVDLAAAPGGTNTYDFTVNKNGSNTALVATISGASVAGNDVEDVSVAAGDLLAYSYIATAPTAPYPGAAMSVCGYISTGSPCLKQMGGML